MWIVCVHAVLRRLHYIRNDMQVEGKNLELTKRALSSHLLYCSEKALRSPGNEEEEKWDPEIKATEELILAVDINLKQYNEAG